MRNEVFVSYSHKDAKHLAELRQFLVPFEREHGVTIWDDHKIQPGSPWQKDIQEALQRAKVAVLLVSANFVASSFISQTELPAILRDAERGGLRILWIAVSASAYHLTNIAGYQAVNDPAKPLDTLRLYQRRAAWVAIAEKIFEFARDSAGPLGKIECRSSVLLAQATDDVADEADQLRSYLGQYDDEIVLLPTSDYPQGGNAFKAVFEEDLRQAKLFVQLLGRRLGRAPPDLPEGYTRYQFERAKASGICVIHWRHPELDTSLVSDVTYRKILTSESVVASGLEAFKREVLELTRAGRNRPSRPPRSSTVFINADERDMDFAKEVERECLRSALTTVLPMTGPASSAIRRDLEENLTDCDVLVFIYGDTTQGWIRSQLKRFNKVKPKRQSAPRLLAICCGPPPKAEIGINFPEAHLVNCPESWNLQLISNLIAELDK